MVSSEITIKDARAIAEEAMEILGIVPYGVQFEITIEHIAQTLSLSRGGYRRWRECVFNAAIEMAESGESPRGARLAMLSEMYL